MMTRDKGTRSGKVFQTAVAPEPALFFFGLLLNLPWEFLQAPLFRGMAKAPHWEATKICTVAALGDAGILVAAYWGTALAASSRRWLTRPTAAHLTIYLLLGFGISLAIERFSLAQGRWAYSDAMPIVPGVDVGLALVIQWLTLPPLALWIALRQITSCRCSRASRGEA